MKVIIITQARIASTRLPNKVLMKIGSQTMLGLHLKRLLNCKNVQKVVVATTNEKGVGEIIKIANYLKVDVFQGSTNDVLDRYVRAANKYNPDYVVRVTSDCPLIDPELIDSIIDRAISSGVDYCSNIITEDFPDGQDVEVFKYSALKIAWKQAILESDREHVTSYIRKNSGNSGDKIFSAYDIKSQTNYNNVRMTIDEMNDLETIRWLISNLGTEKSWLEYTKYMLKNKRFLKNNEIIRNEGYVKSLKNEENG